MIENIKELSINLGAIAEKNGAEVVPKDSCVWCLQPFLPDQIKSVETSLPLHLACQKELNRMRGIIPALPIRQSVTAENLSPSKA